MITVNAYTNNFCVTYSLHSISKFVLPYIVTSVAITDCFFGPNHLLPCVIITTNFSKSELFSDMNLLLEPLLKFRYLK